MATSEDTSIELKRWGPRGRRGETFARLFQTRFARRVVLPVAATFLASASAILSFTITSPPEPASALSKGRRSCSSRWPAREWT